MAYACMSNTGILNAENLPASEWETLKRHQKSLDLKMPCCGSLAGMRGGDHMQKRAHFYHLFRVEGCPSTAAESEAHRQAKAIIRKAAKKAGWEAEEEYWGQATETQFYRADVLVWKGDRKIAFEVQLSPQTDVESERRQQLFCSAGIESVWFFSGTLPLSGFCARIDVGQKEEGIAFQIATREGLSFELKEFVSAFLEGTWDKGLQVYCNIKRQIHQLSSGGGWRVALIPWKGHLPSDPEYWRTSMVLSQSEITVLIETNLPKAAAINLKEAQQEAFFNEGKFAFLTRQRPFFKLVCFWGGRRKTIGPISLQEIIQNSLLTTFLENGSEEQNLLPAPVSLPSQPFIKSVFGDVDPFPKMARVKLHAYTIPCLKCREITVLLEKVTLGWGFETFLKVRDFGEWFWEIFPPALLLPATGYPDRTYLNKCMACETLQPELKRHQNKNEAEEAIIGNYQSLSHARWIKHPIFVTKEIQPGWVKPDRAFFHIEKIL